MRVTHARSARRSAAVTALFTGLLACAASPLYAQITTTVFQTNFDTSLPAEFSAPGAAREAVQGYAGLGPSGFQFGGSFLRYTSVPLYDTKLTVRNLPPHDAVNVRFLLGIIDSWDGTELFKVTVDGQQLFSHWFQLALGDSSDYIAPPGGVLSRGHDLGWSGPGYYYRDRAYDMSVDPAFLDIPHSADSVVVVWKLGAISGPAANQWQGGSDESWAIDQVAVDVVDHQLAVGDESGGSALALTGAWPNPSPANRVRLLFTLPSAGAATLELLDLFGRRVAARDVSELGAGRHSVELAPERRLSPGIYHARLVQGTAARVARVVVVDR